MINMAIGYYGYGYYIDPTYILVIIAAIISLIAQFLVSSTFSKYSRVRSYRGLTGAQAAEMILRNQGIYDVTIRRVSGKLTDNYNPGNKTLNLSDSVYGSTSVAAVGVAAHECGHAIQHAKGYAPLSIRSALVPVASIGSQLSWVFIMLGVVLSFNQMLITIGIVMFSAATAILQLLRLIILFGGRRRDDD